jgi:putative FmdB family regulatory protein
LFEYECRSCGKRFEHLVYGREAAVVCRECGSADVSPLLSTFAVGGSSEKSAGQAGACAGCEGMQDGTCPMGTR